MADHTSHYNLTKPVYGETVDVQDINGNMDALDAIIYDADQYAQSRVSDAYDDTQSYAVGDFCIHENQLYKCISATTGSWDSTAWALTNIAQAFEPKHTWELFETLTADGTDRFVYSSDLPENVTGIMINNTVQAGTAAFTLGIGFSFNGTTYPRTLGVASGINTGIRYSRASYIKDGNLWNSRITLAVTATPSNTTLQERLDTIDIGGDIKKIRIYAPSGEMMPSGSTFEIYIRR